MPTPSEKSPGMAQLLDSMGAFLTGRTRTEAIELGICLVCSNPAKDFDDALTAREYTISGSCQECQDWIFS